MHLQKYTKNWKAAQLQKVSFPKHPLNFELPMLILRFLRPADRDFKPERGYGQPYACSRESYARDRRRQDERPCMQPPPVVPFFFLPLPSLFLSVGVVGTDHDIQRALSRTSAGAGRLQPAKRHRSPVEGERAHGARPPHAAEARAVLPSARLPTPPRKAHSAADVSMGPRLMFSNPHRRSACAKMTDSRST